MQSPHLWLVKSIRCRCAHPHYNRQQPAVIQSWMKAALSTVVFVDAGTPSQINPSNAPFSLKPGTFNVYLIKFRRRESGYELVCCLILHYITSLHYYLEKLLICTLLKLNYLYFVFRFN